MPDASSTIVTISPSRPGDAAFSVLSDPQLFRLLPQWKTGWPARVAQRWCEVSANIEAQYTPPTRAFRSKERRVLLFMRELLLDCDVETLRVTADCTWQDRERECECPSMRFAVTELQFAVRSGHAETVRWAFEHFQQSKGAASVAAKTAWLWQEAMIHLPEDCDDVLDVLHELLPVGEQFWANKASCIRSVRAAQWIVDKFGVQALSPFVLETAALAGNLPLVKCMTNVTGQNVRVVMERLGEYPPPVREFLEATYGTGFLSSVLRWGVVQSVIQRVASLLGGATTDLDKDTGDTSPR